LFQPGLDSEAAPMPLCGCPSMDGFLVFAIKSSQLCFGTIGSLANQRSPLDGLEFLLLLNFSQRDLRGGKRSAVDSTFVIGVGSP
jgi:hypothetical protein